MNFSSIGLGGIVAFLVLVACFILALMGKLAFWPAVLIGFLAFAFICGWPRS